MLTDDLRERKRGNCGHDERDQRQAERMSQSRAIAVLAPWERAENSAIRARK